MPTATKSFLGKILYLICLINSSEIICFSVNKLRQVTRKHLDDLFCTEKPKSKGTISKCDYCFAKCNGKITFIAIVKIALFRVIYKKMIFIHDFFIRFNVCLLVNYSESELPQLTFTCTITLNSEFLLNAPCDENVLLFFSGERPS